MNLKKFFNTEEGGCIIFYIVLFVTLPSLFANFLQCSRKQDAAVLNNQMGVLQDSIRLLKSSCDERQIVSLYDSISFYNNENRDIVKTIYEEAGEIEEQYGETFHPHMIKYGVEDFFKNSVKLDSLLKELNPKYDRRRK